MQKRLTVPRLHICSCTEPYRVSEDRKTNSEVLTDKTKEQKVKSGNLKEQVEMR